MSVLTEDKLKKMLSLVFPPALEIKVSEHVPANNAFRIVGTPYVICGWKFKRSLDWELDIKKRWEGRNWRRIKRERRKFLRRQQ